MRPIRSAGSASFILLVLLVGAWGHVSRAYGADPGSPFEVSASSVAAVNAQGQPETQAGGHPAELITTVEFSSEDIETLGAQKVKKVVPVQDPKDIAVTLPGGMIGDPLAVPRCPLAVFDAGIPQWCPATSQVGTANIFYGGIKFEDGVYDLIPPSGHPAELGITTPLGTNFVLNAGVRANEGYRLDTESKGTPMVGLVKATVTIWGVPAESTHDALRGRDCTFFEADDETLCKEGREGGAPSELTLKPFLTMPTQCTGESLEANVAADSWQQTGPLTSDGGPELLSPLWKLSSATLPPLTGCDALSFDSSIKVVPETDRVDSPTGIGVVLEVPQTDSPEASATPELRDASVTMPAGMSLSPAAGSGLEACSDLEFDKLSSSPANCPEKSQIGTVTVETPVLEHSLEGELFLAEPECGNASHPNIPCEPHDAAEGRIFRVFLQVLGSGVTVKLPGSASVNPLTGQITTVFAEDPQLPFNRLTINIKGGPSAPLANAQSCGEARTTTDLTPWSAPGRTAEGTLIPGTPDAMPSSSFSVTGCAGTTPFAPSFTAGTVSSNAGVFTPFTLTLVRQDGEQDISGLQVTMPPGLLGTLTGVPLCGEPQASQGTCPAASQIGTTHVASGSGEAPLWLSGPVYLTTGYKGAPFGLSIVVPAVAGPFNLGKVVVRSAITVDPGTSAITVTTDPFPQIIDGVQTRLRTLNATIDRPAFIFNPTNCSQMQIVATAASAQGGSDRVSSPFAVGDCKTLPFKPVLTSSVQGKGITRKYGTSFIVKVTQKHGEANIHAVAVSLPKLLPSRLTTLNQSCPAATFAENPAVCPSGSDIGVATASTPVLPVKLTGPVYLVSHGGAAFPEVVVVLQGYGIRLDLTGKILISPDNITHSTFGTVPDAPISSFEMKLPESSHSAFGSPIANLCGKRLVMPTRITAQNGVVARQETKVATTGCPRAKAKKVSGKSSSRGRGSRRSK